MKLHHKNIMEINENSPRYSKHINGSLVELKPHQLAILNKMEDMESKYFSFAERMTSDLSYKELEIKKIKTEIENIQKALKKEENNRFVCDDLSKELEEYKKDLISRQTQYNSEMSFFLKEGFGVLGTNVGSGKTYCIIAQILLDKMKTNIGPINNDTVKGTMIIVPPHLYYQWVEAFDTFVEKGLLQISNFNHYNEITLLYEPKYRAQLLTSDVYMVNLNNYEILANTLTDNGICIKRVVFDEINTMSSLVDTTVSSAFTWFVSASLQNEIKRDPKYMITGYGHTGEDILKKIIRADDKFVFDSFQIPPYKYKKENVPNPSLEKLVHIKGLLEQNGALEALNACDPILAFKNLNIRISMMGSERKQNNELQFTSVLYKKLQDIPEEINTNLESLKKTQKSSNITTEKDILQESIDSETEKLNKYVTFIEKLKTILPDENSEEFKNLKRPKIVRLMNIIDRLKDQKVMIYSKYPRLFSEVEKECEENGIGFTNFEDGTEEKMNETMKSFKTDSKINILCAHSVMFSCGTNLENLTHIIFMHKVHPDVKKQVIGRGQRPGRTGPLTVIEMLHKNETE
jgi:hypothetical protein